MNINELNDKEIKTLKRILMATSKAIQRAMDDNRMDKETISEAWDVCLDIQNINQKLDKQYKIT